MSLSTSDTSQSGSNSKLRIAAINTVFFPLSHADVILSRWLEPRETDPAWGWSDPQSVIASIWIDQFPQNDIGREFCKQNEIPLCATIEEALTLHTNRLAVDGILIIGEHGEYPINTRGQKLYPRKEFFDEVIRIFKKYGQTVPVFSDKQLSWNPAWALEMVRTAHRLDFPLVAGSTAPYCETEGNLHISPDDTIVDALGVFCDGPETYGFHSLEFVQSILQTRTGGEPGIRSITAYQGDQIWAALTESIEELLSAALKCALHAKAGDYRENCKASPIPPTLFSLEHFDGLRSYHLLLHGHVADFTMSLRLKNGEIRAGRAKMGGSDSFYGHFARLNSVLETMFLSGHPPATSDRVLLTTLTVAGFMEALLSPGEPIFPDLNMKKLSGLASSNECLPPLLI
jgi:hypothetical protein